MKGQLSGDIWFNRGKRGFLGQGRIALLENIHATGSLAKASKRMGMSYKAAWDTLNAMASLSEKPLVERSTGGRDGGGTIVTPYGLKLIATFRALEKEHRLFLERLSRSIESE